MLYAVLQVGTVGGRVEGSARVVLELIGFWVAFEVAVVLIADCALKSPE